MARKRSAEVLCGVDVHPIGTSIESGNPIGTWQKWRFVGLRVESTDLDDLCGVGRRLVGVDLEQSPVHALVVPLSLLGARGAEPDLGSMTRRHALHSTGRTHTHTRRSTRARACGRQHRHRPQTQGEVVSAYLPGEGLVFLDGLDLLPLLAREDPRRWVLGAISQMVLVVLPSQRTKKSDNATKNEEGEASALRT